MSDNLIADLKQAQRVHLKAIERWGKRQGTIAKVPVIQALTYELIQLVNQAYLEEKLKGEADG